MAAALRFRSHGQPHASLITWLGNYTVATPGVALGDAPTVRLDSDNEPLNSATPKHEPIQLSLQPRLARLN